MILGVNVDHVATVRNTRNAFEPDPVMAATMSVLGGADGITVHLREDRRHIKDRDLRILREVVLLELNLEMAATKEMVEIAIRTKPDLVTLVPEKREELTTEGGLDVQKQKTRLKNIVSVINDAGIPVSLFVNPLIDDVDVSKDIGAQMVEIHTGLYANAKGERKEKELIKIKKAVRDSMTLGLKANAGHGLDYSNVRQIADINDLRGLYIGHSIISRAVLVGIERAVKEMKEIIKR
ncbi:MAG: pyridoxine 5'-phosphate synthase [Nitrospiraceae bacterium]|nr:pyridoxine 5'-phosphate synthase [Nitrospiraceae bacterium]